MAHPNKVKGRAFELKVAKVLKAIWATARRGIQFRDGGKEAGDIEGVPLHVECSKGAESIWAKWQQALDDAVIRKLPPVVVKQRDRDKPVVMMHLQTFAYLLTQDYRWKDAYIEQFGEQDNASNYCWFPDLSGLRKIETGDK